MAKRLTRERNDRAWLAWHTAMIGRVKKPPKLKELLVRDGRQKRKQTVEEQIAIAKRWTAALARKR